MPTISGPLKYVTGRAEDVSAVQVSAPSVRTSSGAVITTSVDVKAVTGGSVTFTCEPGPAVLTLLSVTGPVESIPLLVGTAATQTLAQVVDAAALAQDADKTALDALAVKVAADAATATKAAAEAKASVKVNTVTVQTEAEAQALTSLRKGDYVVVLDTGNVYKEV